jgi:hypothetical protein
VPNANGYRIQLAPDAEFHSFLVDSESAAAQVDVPAPADGSYWLRVRSIDNLGLEGQDAVRTFVQHRMPVAPAPTTPSPGAVAVGEGAAFAWSALEPGFRYRVQIARDKNFTDGLLERNVGQATQINIDRVAPGHYFWRVAGVNDRDEHGDWSPIQEYTQLQAAPVPSPPTFKDREMQLQWESRSGLSYRIQIARDPEFTSPLLDQRLDAPSVSMRRPRAGIYYARVQTIAEDGSTTPFGEARRFEVPAPRWLKILLPLLTLLTLVR